MKDLKEKIAYLQGLAEGMEVNSSTKEGKILIKILDVLEEMADTIYEIGDAQVDLEEYVEAVDEDLYDLENDVYEEDDEEECCCGGDHECYDDLDEEDYYLDDEDEEIDFVEVECPECNDVVCFDSDIMDSEDIIEVTCPNCNHVVFINDGSIEIYDVEEDENE